MKAPRTYVLMFCFVGIEADRVLYEDFEEPIDNSVEGSVAAPAYDDEYEVQSFKD